MWLSFILYYTMPLWSVSQAYGVPTMCSVTSESWALYCWGGLLMWFLLNWKFLSWLKKLAPFQWWKFNKLDGAGCIQKAGDVFLCKEFISLRRMQSWRTSQQKAIISVTFSQNALLSVLFSLLAFELNKKSIKEHALRFFPPVSLFYSTYQFSEEITL